MRLPPTDPPAGGRQPLLDLWRGLALVDMAWVHLASYPVGMTAEATDFIIQHTRFAAGCLVLLSGLTVRTAFGGRLAAGGGQAAATVRRLLRRAALLMAVDRLACLGFAVIARVALDATPIDGEFAASLVRVATFAEPGATGGLLLLYCILLASTPLLEALRSRRGEAFLVATSFAVFLAAQAAGEAAHWPPWAFPIAHWQPLFVVGYAVAPWLLRAHDWTGAHRLALPLAATAACGLVFALRSPLLLGIDPASLPSLDFTKFPLKPAELAWYLASSAFVMAWSGLAWNAAPALRGSARWLVALGQSSLLAYVSHLLLEPPLVALVTVLDPSPWERALTLPAIVLAMVAVVRAGESVGAARESVLAAKAAWLRAIPSALPTAGAVGLVVAVACTTAAFVERPWMIVTLENQRATAAAAAIRDESAREDDAGREDAAVDGAFADGPGAAPERGAPGSGAVPDALPAEAPALPDGAAPATIPVLEH